MRRIVGPGLLVACCLALGAGCRGVSITRVRGNPTARAVERLGRLPDLPPFPTVGAHPRDPDALLARAVAGCRSAVAAERESRETAAAEALGALADAWGALAASGAEPRSRPDGPREAAARGVIDEATRLSIRLTSGRRIKFDRRWRDDLASRGVRVTVLPGPPAWDPDRLDEFLFADDYVVKGVNPPLHSGGLGVPMIGLRRFRYGDLEGRQGEEKFLMPRQVYPVTAVLRAVPTPDGRPPEFRLELHDPVLEPRLATEAGPQPLAADLTTPLVYHFARSPLPILQEVGLLDPQWLEKLAGLYMLHPYERGKIPLILVHGLRSSPAAWTKVINELRGDPWIRERYQFWLFLYPTGTPFPASAGKLRAMLDELRETVDPAHADAALDRSVLVGHSMGGLISKMMVLRSGDEVWKLISDHPFDELKATPERKELLRDVFFFEPHPSIRRVVFIATPHRGSELGDQFIGRLADRLIRLPAALQSGYRAVLAQNDPDFFLPEVRSGVPSSIDELRRDNPLLMTLNRLPVAAGVPYHSIIGQRDPAVPVEQGSDGVVPYVSSHLDGARSERVVPGTHSCQDVPETIAELRRILRLHLDRNPTAARVSAGVPVGAASR